MVGNQEAVVGVEAVQSTPLATYTVIDYYTGDGEIHGYACYFDSTYPSAH